jgi:hypothetical protein
MCFRCQREVVGARADARARRRASRRSKTSALPATHRPVVTWRVLVVEWPELDRTQPLDVHRVKIFVAEKRRIAEARLGVIGSRRSS